LRTAVSQRIDIDGGAHYCSHVSPHEFAASPNLCQIPEAPILTVEARESRDLSASIPFSAAASIGAARTLNKCCRLYVQWHYEYKKAARSRAAGGF
jgi:hypothetical protein